jgi:hypothetical protein
MNKKNVLLLLWLILALASCAPMDAPQLIAEHPVEEAIAVYPKIQYPEPGETLIYNAGLTLEVRNVDNAAQKAIQLASALDGYLQSSNTWYQNDDKLIALVLVVPAWRFDEMHTELLKLGKLISEQISGDLIPAEPNSWTQYSYFTVQLHPKDTVMPPISFPDWRPITTFQKAWDVFMAIFGFLVDIVIWILVVIGPFILLGWLGRLLYRKIKIQQK